MNNHKPSFSRRQFLRVTANSLVYTSMALAVPNALADNLVGKSHASVLPFREGAKFLALHYNENSLGMSPKALKATQAAIASLGNRYADTAVDELTALIAKTNGLSEQQLIMGNGSTEILGAVVEYAASLGATLLEPSPTFGDVRSRAKARGMNVVSVALGSDFVTDIDQLKKKALAISGPLLINICNPNNPTGAIVDKTALANWIATAPDNYLFLIDEAYYEYAQLNSKYASAIPLIQQGKENLIVARTFSKIYGMAGMRVGYGMAAPKTAAKINALAASFNLSIGGVTAAIESLHDNDYFKTSLSSNTEAKKILTTTLDELDLAYIESDTNFVLHRINSDLQSYSQKMLNNKIKVGRRMTTEDGWNRLSLGTPSEMQSFTQTLKAFREKGWV